MLECYGMTYQILQVGKKVHFSDYNTIYFMHYPSGAVLTFWLFGIFFFYFIGMVWSKSFGVWIQEEKKKTSDMILKIVTLVQS